jgi:flagellar basal-body rod protein FlgC
VGFYSSVEISASGLSAERLAMDVIANNIANANTTRTPEGGPFKRQLIIFAAKPDPTGQQPGADTAMGSQTQGLGGVEAVGIVNDTGPDKMVYDPTHPDADTNGYVHYPNVEVVKEMVDMMAASRAYEANVTAIQDARQMGTATLGLLNA